MLHLNRFIPFTFGLAMSINFIIIWAIPVMGMGALWKNFFKPILFPAYKYLDESRSVRSFAEEFIYTKPEHADFFVISVLIILNTIISLGAVFYYQLHIGDMPYWLIFAYYCSWVGIGGRTMGGAYALAHKEVTTEIFDVSNSQRILNKHFIALLFFLLMLATVSFFSSGP